MSSAWDDIEETFNDVGDMIDGFTGETAAEASMDAAGLQFQSAQNALAYSKERDALARADLQPYAQAGNALLPFYTSFLNPANQGKWLETNPMFQAALNRNETGLKNTLGFSGKRGDLSNAITQNYMSTGNQLVQQQLDNMFRGVNLGQASAAGQAMGAQDSARIGSELITGGANALGAGVVGAANAQQQGMNNMVNAGMLMYAMSDRRLKKHITRIGSYGPYNAYAWQYRGGDDTIHIGVMADEVEKINPGAVTTIDGFKAVNYGAL